MHHPFFGYTPDAAWSSRIYDISYIIHIWIIWIWICSIYELSVYQDAACSEVAIIHHLSCIYIFRIIRVLENHASRISGFRILQWLDDPVVHKSGNQIFSHSACIKILYIFAQHCMIIKWNYSQNVGVKSTLCHMCIERHTIFQLFSLTNHYDT